MRQIIVGVSIGLLFHILLEYREFFLVSLNLSSVEDFMMVNPDVKLAVIIMSSRDHFTYRDTIRNSWMKDISYNQTIESNIKAWFVVGDKPCMIPPEYRTDAYTCTEFTTSMKILPRNKSLSLMSARLSSPSDTGGKINLITEFFFRVYHPVIIKQLGIVDCISFGSVELIDLQTEDEVVKVVFSEEDYGIFHGGYRYQPVEQYFLPKGFEGKLKITIDFKEIENCHQSNMVSDMNDRHFIIEYLKNSKLFLMQQTDLSLFSGSLTYILQDTDTFVELIENKPVVYSDWKEFQLQVDVKLKNEIEENKDMLLVDAIDVYRNIPEKLVLSHVWLKINTHSRNVLKTDDDCFVDLPRIYDYLAENELRDQSWLGNFRYDWYVEKAGKWRELEYNCLSYPPFACGSGNIVSRGVHKWIADNSDSLHRYQGEDVSLGIWLAAIGADIVVEDRFVCENICHKDSFVVPELSFAEILRMWRSKNICGNPCGCSSSKQT